MLWPEMPTRRLRRVEYERLVDAGLLDDEPIELLDGLMVFREPQSTPHAAAIQLAHEALRAAFGPGWHVRAQLPVALDDDSEPEPDISVVPGSPRDYVGSHPARPVLVLEAARRSLGHDRTVKAALYARARVPDYWIVNLVDCMLEVRRESAPAANPIGWDYRVVSVLTPADVVSPLGAPAASIPVADLLP
jgi:Uma2 family endonuclease